MVVGYGKQSAGVVRRRVKMSVGRPEGTTLTEAPGTGGSVPINFERVRSDFQVWVPQAEPVGVRSRRVKH